jgi:hypothetical protein
VDLYPALAADPLPLGTIVAGLAPDIQQIYLAGDRPGRGNRAAMYAWLANLGEGWAHDGSNPDAEAPVLRLVHAASGRKMDIRRAADWFDEGEYTAADAQAAYDLLQSLIQQAWPGAALLTTPAGTGLALWELSTPPGVTFEPLDSDTRALISSTSGQGRIELCALSDQAPGYYYLDGRFMYAALCKELPGRLIAHDTCDEMPPYQRARYRVRFTVPADWAHVGLLMAPVEGTQDAWHYPAAPGATGETWADGVEVELARARGWDVRILERLLFDRARPLDTWAGKLISLRERVRATEETTATALAGSALRNIVLRTIGTFARRERRATKLIDAAGLAHYDLERGSVPHQVAAGLWQVEEPEALPARAARYQHPEWAAAVWARARSRLLYNRVQESGALTVPRADVLGMYVDALYLSRDPGWVDSGAPGQFRVKGSIPKPIQAPKKWPEMWKLRDRALGGASDGSR